MQICLSSVSPTSDKSEKSAKSFITDLILKSGKDDVWSGRVVFSINNTILLKDIKVQSLTELSTDDMIVSEIFVKQHFIENNWAVKDTKHLKNLYKLAENTGIYYNKSSIKGEELLSVGSKEEACAERKMKSEGSKKYKKTETESFGGNLELKWSCLEEPFNQVEFLKAENTSLVFVRQTKYKKK